MLQNFDFIYIRIEFCVSLGNFFFLFVKTFSFRPIRNSISTNYTVHEHDSCVLLYVHFPVLPGRTNNRNSIRCNVYYPRRRNGTRARQCSWRTCRLFCTVIILFLQRSSPVRFGRRKSRRKRSVRSLGENEGPGCSRHCFRSWQRSRTRRRTTRPAADGTLCAPVEYSIRVYVEIRSTFDSWVCASAGVISATGDDRETVVGRAHRSTLSSDDALIRTTSPPAGHVLCGTSGDRVTVNFFCFF